MAWPNNNVAALMDDGSISNGAWMAALSTVFTCPQYVLAPEWLVDNIRPDFTVIAVGQGAFFPFEGKGTGHNWDSLVAEVRQYTQESAHLGSTDIRTAWEAMARTVC